MCLEHVCNEAGVSHDQETGCGEETFLQRSIREAARSGVSIREFCRQHLLKEREGVLVRLNQFRCEAGSTPKYPSVHSRDSHIGCLLNEYPLIRGKPAAVCKKSWPSSLIKWFFATSKT